MRRQYVVLVGYGRLVEAHRDGETTWWAYRDTLHRLAWDYARTVQSYEGGSLYLLSEWHGVVTEPWRLPRPPEGPRLAKRPEAAQRRWAAECVSQLLLLHGGNWLKLEIHDWQPNVTTLRGCLPSSWRESEPLRGSESHRVGWYRRELPAVRRLAERHKSEWGGT